MTSYPCRATPLALATLIALPAAAADLDHTVQNFLSQAFTTSVLLTDGETMRFGFWDFDPNEFIELDDDNFGNAEATAKRQNITSASLPWSWTLDTPIPGDELQLYSRLSYLEVVRKGQIVASDSTLNDEIDHTVTSGTLGVNWRQPLDGALNLTLRQNFHWMHYDNETKYRSEQSRTVQPFLDGVLTNFSVNAVMAEPSAMLSYDLTSRRGTEWHLFTDYHYMLGDTYDTAITAHDANPEAWFWSNGARMKSPLISSLLRGQNVWFRAARVDMGADLDGALGNSHYYEAGVAWLLDTGDHIPLLDNIGIGLNFNYGSVLRGGSLVLMLNEH